MIQLAVSSAWESYGLKALYVHVMTAIDTPTTYGSLDCISLLLPGLDLQMRRV